MFTEFFSKCLIILQITFLSLSKLVHEEEKNHSLEHFIHYIHLALDKAAFKITFKDSNFMAKHKMHESVIFRKSKLIKTFLLISIVSIISYEYLTFTNTPKSRNNQTISNSPKINVNNHVGTANFYNYPLYNIYNDSKKKLDFGILPKLTSEPILFTGKG